MKKKIFIISIIGFLVVISFFNSNEEKEIENNQITILLENENGNTKIDGFPSKVYYQYDKIICDNLGKDTSLFPVFDEENWKLNVNLNSVNKVDGKFECEIYFKEREKKKVSDAIISKYSEDNTEGLIKVEQPATVQTKETTEYRYSGSNDVVKNYVNFNNETWRIIGVFDTDDGTGKIEKRVKLIRDEAIGNYSWDSTPSDINSGWGSNQWGESGSYPGADLMQELNDTYYNRSNKGNMGYDFTTTGLKEESRNMIAGAKWYTGAVTFNTSSTITKQAYIDERSNKVGATDSGQSIIKTSNWIGKVALMYSSDYGYASKDCYSETVLWNYNSSTCQNSNWLYQSLLNTPQWTLAPYEPHNYRALDVRSAGNVGYSHAYNTNAIRPSIYLKSNVKIIKGDGSINDKYEFGM